MEPIDWRERAWAIERAAKCHSFECLLEEIAAHVIRPGMLAIDGGAHYGQHLFHMATRVGIAGAVYAFEPQNALREFISLRMKEYVQVHPTTIVLSGSALSNRRGKASFLHVPAAPALSGLSPRPALVKGMDMVPFDVIVTTIDDELKGAPQRCGFIKLDVEGAEFDAIQGARRTLENDRPVVAFEWGQSLTEKASGYTRRQLFDFWDDIGYEMFDLFGRPFLADEPDDWTRPYIFLAAPQETDFGAFVHSFLPQAAERMADLRDRLQHQAAS